MKYNQPYDQPSNPNASYTNGNPSAGIQGSIVPAEAVEYPQREIVRAITDVNLAAPTNGDLTQLSAAVRFMRMQYVIDTGPADSLQVTLNPAPTAWATPLSFFILIKNTTLTAAPVITIAGITGAKAIIRRDGSSLAIGDLVGGAIALLTYDGTNCRVISIVPSDYTSGGGPPPTFNIWIDAPTTFTVYGTGANFADLPTALEYISKYIITTNGSVILQLPAGQATCAVNLAFDHANGDKVTLQGQPVSTPPTAADFTVTAVTNPGLATDQANALAMLRMKFPTELRMTGGTGITTGNGFTFKNLLITSDGAGSFVAGMLLKGGPTTTLSNISVHGFSGPGILTRGNVVISGNVTASGNYLSLPPPAASWPVGQNAGGGIEVTDGGHVVNNAEVVAASNDCCGVIVRNGSFRLYGMLPGSWETPGYPLTCKGNGHIGLYCSGGGNFTGQQAVFNNNGERGVLVDTGSMYGQGFTFNGNISYGLWATESDVQIQPGSGHPVPSFSGNGGGSIMAQLSANVVASGGTGIVGTCSPPANTTGNSLSTIFV